MSANSIITAANAPTARNRRAVIQSMCPVTTSAARTGVAVMAKNVRLHFMEARTGQVLSSPPMLMPVAASRPGPMNAA